jgi:hypothetical protein
MKLMSEILIKILTVQWKKLHIFSRLSIKHEGDIITITKVMKSHVDERQLWWLENLWLIDYYLRFYVPLKNISLIWRRHHCRWRAAKFRPMLGAQDLWAGRDLYRTSPAVTRDLGYSGLIRRTAQFSRLLRHTRGCGGSILTRILTGWKFIWVSCEFILNMNALLTFMFAEIGTYFSLHCMEIMNWNFYWWLVLDRLQIKFEFCCASFAFYWVQWIDFLDFFLHCMKIFNWNFIYGFVTSNVSDEVWKFVSPGLFSSELSCL